MYSKSHIFCTFAKVFPLPSSMAEAPPNPKRHIFMADRTFHKRITIQAKIAIGLFSILALYFFWTKVAIIGLFVAIVVVGMIERILHTTYTFRRVKPIDMECEMEFLVVDEGRFSANRNIPLCDVVRTEKVSAFFGMDHGVLIEYGAGNMTTVQPDNETAFVQELQKRIATACRQDTEDTEK